MAGGIPAGDQGMTVGPASETETQAATPSDAALVARCREGDAQAWDQLVDRFARYVYAIATQAYRLSEHDAEDVFQEVFARIYVHLPELRDDDAIRPWVAQTTRRLAVDKLRAARREQPETSFPESAAPDAALERIDVALDVYQAMAGLPENCREILERFFAQDQSYQVIGAALGIASGTIASRISRCLAKLRAALEEHHGA
jgi:RNA polymerase sigma factor (sigma-70 family)